MARAPRDAKARHVGVTGPSFICFRVSSLAHEGDNILLHPVRCAVRVCCAVAWAWRWHRARQDLWVSGLGDVQYLTIPTCSLRHPGVEDADFQVWTPLHERCCVCVHGGMLGCATWAIAQAQLYSVSTRAAFRRALGSR